MVVSWILQALLAIAFLVAGGMKVLKTREELLAQGSAMTWVGDFGPGQIRTIGALEVLGAVGLVVPALIGTLTILTPVAAAGLLSIMVGAIATHLRRREYGALVPPVTLAAMALAVIVLQV